MAAQVADAPGLGTIEERSIDWVPEDARHGKLWHRLGVRGRVGRGVLVDRRRRLPRDPARRHRRSARDQDRGQQHLPSTWLAAAFFLAAGLAATMGMNAYGGVLSLLTGINSVRAVGFGRRARIVTIVALTVVWYAIGKAVTGSAVNTVLTSLTLMLYLLVPWTATNLVDYFFVRRAHYAIADLFTPSGIYGRWGRNGLIAYAVGFLAEIPFMVLPDIGGTSLNGPIADQISDVDISWVVGLIVAGAVYWLLSRSTNVSAELDAARREAGGADTVIT